MAIERELLHSLATEEPAAPPLDLSWLDEARAERGITAKPGKRGLTLDEINIGSYGRVPAYSDNQTMRPRGTAVREGVPHTGYYIRDAGTVWSQNASMLYEEAVQRQWSSATDIPWEPSNRCPTRSSAPCASSARSSSRVHRLRHAVKVDPDDLQQPLRDETLPRHAGDGRGAASRCLPQARARERRRAAGLEPDDEPAHDHQRPRLHGDVIDHARAGGRIRAEHVPHGRTRRQRRRREAHSSACARRTSRGIWASASCT